jgi:hypothetical protein
MCDGNLAMANRFVDMSEDEMDELYEWEIFKEFATAYPVEAFDERPSDFCKFMREEGYDMTDEQIKELIDDVR